MIEIEMKGLNSVVKNLGKVESLIKDRSIFREAALFARNEAKRLSPVDTGILRQSIYFETAKDGFYLGAKAPYAIFNEYGSIKTPAGSIESPLPAKKHGQRPFLRPALYETWKKFPEIFKKKFNSISSQGMRL